MKNTLKIRTALSAVLLALVPRAQGQAIPAGIAAAPQDPFLPALDGKVHYSLTASELVQFGYYGPGGTVETTALSGNVAYQSTSMVRPFSLLASAGLLLGNQPGLNGVSSYENVSVSQGLVTRSWVFNLSDSLSFLPESPTTGLSGVPGTGDLGVVPIQGPANGPGGGILSYAGRQIANTLSGSGERRLDHATSLSGSASWSVLQFPNSSTSGGFNSSQVSGTVAVNRRIDSRSSASLNAMYETISYSGAQVGLFAPDIEVRGLNVSYQRRLTRSLSAAGSIGPQWVSSSDSRLIPSSLNLAATASLTYAHRDTNASVAYSRGVNAGSGVLPGVNSDSISGGIGRSYGRDWVTSASGSYVRSSGLTQVQAGAGAPVNATYDTAYAGVQVTRRINQPLSAYASYNVQHQSSNGLSGAQTPFSGTSHTIGVGITFTPRSTRLGQF